MTFKIITLGCKINSYESQSIRESFLSLNFKEVDDNYLNPTYIIINTCGVTNQAERKCTKVLHHESKSNPKSKIIVCGCSSQIHKEYYLNNKNVKLYL